MRAAPDRTALEAYHKSLARAFAKRRCTCGARAMSVAPGDLPVVEMKIVTQRGKADRCYCLRCMTVKEQTRKRPVRKVVDGANA